MADLKKQAFDIETADYSAEINRCCRTAPSINREILGLIKPEAGFLSAHGNPKPQKITGQDFSPENSKALFSRKP